MDSEPASGAIAVLSVMMVGSLASSFQSSEAFDAWSDPTAGATDQ